MELISTLLAPEIRLVLKLLWRASPTAKAGRAAWLGSLVKMSGSRAAPKLCAFRFRPARSGGL
eukprot:10098069-Alexandrium_andersonii.AAC.1